MNVVPNSNPNSETKKTAATENSPANLPAMSGHSAFLDTGNPLVNLSYRIPYDKITEEHIVPAITELLAEAASLRDKIINETGHRTFENTLLSYQDITRKLNLTYSIIESIEELNDNDKFTEKYNEVIKPVSEFRSSLTLSEGLWEAIKTYSESPDVESLSPARKRYLDLTVQKFRCEGADLSPELKAEVTLLNTLLTELTSKFRQNISNSMKQFDYIITDEKQLAGLPQSAIDQARANAEEKEVDGWRFTLQGPSYASVMTYMDDASVREKLYLEYTTNLARTEPYDNGKIISSILEARQRKAEILGHENCADLYLENRMAKTGSRAKEFLADMKKKIQSRFEQESLELQEYRRKLEGENAPPLEAWDISYYSEKLKQESYQFDDEILRPYFPHDRVITGMFEIANELFGITITEVPGFPVWHESVKTYGVFDEDGTLLGTYYTDYFSREGKREGAWMSSFIEGYMTPAGLIPHHGINGANFPPPIDGKPSLLSKDDVETCVHEFFHWLHECFGNLEIPGLGVENVAWDFIEFPSMLGENWTWEREALDIISGHYETGEKIPQEYMDAMLNAKNFRSASFAMRQLAFGMVDLALHTEYKPEIHGDVLKFARDYLQDFSIAKLPENYSVITAFHHAFGEPVGYAAGYYSYKWAEVLEADGFTRFQKEGIFNRETGRALREEVLAKGSSEPAEILFRNFMGRDPDNNALLRRTGIID